MGFLGGFELAESLKFEGFWRFLEVQVRFISACLSTPLLVSSS